MHGNIARADARDERLDADVVNGRRDQCAANFHCRSEELVDGTNSFGNEEAVSLARVAALQVTGYTEHAHAIWT